MRNLLKVPDVAERLNVPLRTAYYLISKGDLPSVKLGPQIVRVDEEDLNTFIENRKNENAATS